MSELEDFLETATGLVDATSAIAVSAWHERLAQDEAAIQSVHAQRAVTGRLNLDALLMLYDLLVAHTDAIGSRIGRAVVIAEGGDPDAALIELEGLPADKVAKYQPWWVARSHVAHLAGQSAIASTSLRQAIDLTLDAAVKAHLAARLAVLEKSGNTGR
jgi:RNA polymerase sigma-70 factor (ECF subfamily)